MSAQVADSYVHARELCGGGEPPCLQLDAVLCNATAVIMGPAETYGHVVRLHAALCTGPLQWSAGALQLPRAWQEYLAARAQDEGECQGNLQALTEYFDMMRNFSEEKALVASHATLFSRASVWRFGPAFRLVLDGVLMSDTRDEHIYHEMLVHPALLAAEALRRVLIVGGGEGATLREVLKDARVERVTMVEIDEGLVRLCREHLGAMHRGSFESPRVELLFEDGAAFLARAEPGSFDAVIVDGIDFQEEESYGNVLFSRSLYREAFRVLRPGGVLAQYMSHVDRGRAMRGAGFSEAVSFTVDVPSFFGAGARFTLAGKGLPEALALRLQRRLNEEAPSGGLGRGWAYLTAETMAQSLQHRGRRLKGSLLDAGPGYGSWGHAQSVSWSVFPNHLAYAGFVVSTHARRRRGVWHNNWADGCEYSAEHVILPPDGGVNSTENPADAAAIEGLCANTIAMSNFNNSLCHACDDCTEDDCVESMEGCSEFLTVLYQNCMQETNLPMDILTTLCLAGLCGGGLWLLYSAWRKYCRLSSNAVISQLEKGRADMTCCNARGFASMEWQGTYNELGEEGQKSRYSWMHSRDGDFEGTCYDDDGPQAVTGKMNWLPGQTFGEIAWCERRPGVTTEVRGRIQLDAARYKIQADYVSSYNGETRGNLELFSVGTNEELSPLLTSPS